MSISTEHIQKSQADGTRYSAEEKFYKAWAEDALKIKAERAKLLKERSSLGARFAKRTFETFDEERDPKAYSRCLEYMEHYKDAERNCLLIVGDYGTGKTHLAAAISNRLLDNGVPVLFDTFGGHLYKLKAEFDGASKGYINQMKTVDMLVLDDVGKEKQTDWSQSVMYEVINHRYEHMLPMVITTNLSNKDLEAYLGGAVWSRICEMCVGVKMTGADYRKG